MKYPTWKDLKRDYDQKVGTFPAVLVLWCATAVLLIYVALRIWL